MELLGGNAYFCAEAEFAAVCETGGSIDIDSCCVYLLLEFPCVCKGARNDALRMLCAVLSYMSDRLVDVVNYLDCYDEVVELCGILGLGSLFDAAAENRDGPVSALL